MAKCIVYFYDLILTAQGQSRAADNAANFPAPPKSISEIMVYVAALYLSGDNLLHKGYSKDAESFYISDFKLDAEKAILLINRSDPKAPDAVSSKPEEKKRHVHKKPEGHGGEFSAHAIIFLSPERGHDRYLCIFESAYGSGISATTIKSYLSHIIRHCKKQLPDEFKIPNINGARLANGKPMLVHLNHDIQFRGHPSEQFKTDLENGRLSTIELVSYSEEGATWDDRGFVKERKRTVELEPNPDLISDVMSTVRSVRNRIVKSNKEYRYLRIKFKTEQGDNKDATVSADTGELFAAEQYVKKHALNMPIVKSNSFDTIQELIIQKMLEIER